MGEVTSLSNANNSPDPDVIEALEDALECAKKGELREVIIYGTVIGNRYYINNRFFDGTMLIGALELMKVAILRDMKL